MRPKIASLCVVRSSDFFLQASAGVTGRREKGGGIRFPLWKTVHSRLCMGLRSVGERYALKLEAASPEASTYVGRGFGGKWIGVCVI